MRRDIVGISQRQRQKYDLLKMLVEGNVTSQYDGRLMATTTITTQMEAGNHSKPGGVLRTERF
jgi:hypothetical protein